MSDETTLINVQLKYHFIFFALQTLLKLNFIAPLFLGQYCINIQISMHDIQATL